MLYPLSYEGGQGRILSGDGAFLDRLQRTPVRLSVTGAVSEQFGGVLGLRRLSIG